MSNTSTEIKFVHKIDVNQKLSEILVLLEVWGNVPDERRYKEHAVSSVMRKLLGADLNRFTM